VASGPIVAETTQATARWATSAASRRSLVSFYDRRVPGRVVLFHGTSSSGKTTVARAVQRLSDEPWVHLGIDTFWNAIDERWMEHGPRAAEGFLWSEDATIVPGPVGQRLARGMRAALAAFARAGNDVLVDDVFIDPAWLVGWRKSSSTSSRCS
jgi:chloramphenicol 3-O-phosphotransferase